MPTEPEKLLQWLKNGAEGRCKIKNADAYDAYFVHRINE